MILGSFYRPERGEVIIPGLSGEDNHAIENMSFAELMFDPIRKIADIVAKSRRNHIGVNLEEKIEAETT